MKRWYAIALVIVSSPVVAAPPDWQWEHPAPFGGTVVAVAGNGAVVHGVGERGSIAVSRDGGTSWHAVAGDTTEDLHAVAETGKLVVAVGDGGAIVRSRDGETFKRQRVASKQSFVAVDASASAIVALASDGAVLRSTDGGDSFAAIAGVPTTRATSIVLSLAGIFVGGDDGIWHSRDGVAAFTHDTTEPVQRLVVASDGGVYALAGTIVRYPATEICDACFDLTYKRAALYRTTDGGASWQRKTLVDPTTPARRWALPTPPVPPATPPSAAVQGWTGSEIRHGNGPPIVEPVRPAGTLAIGSRGDVIAEPDGGLWVGDRAIEIKTSRVDEGMQMLALAATPKGRVLAAGVGGVLARDASGAWAKSATPTGREQRLRQIIALDEDHVVVVGEGGVILTSTDGGASFQQRASGSKVHLAAVWGAGREVFAAGFGDGLLHSTDFGATWTEIATTLPQVWGLWGSSPTNLYALSSRIYHSDDHGATWTAIAGERTGEGLWGTGSYVYVVGPDGRISRTSDRGKTWTRLATGTTKDLRRITGHGTDLVAVGGDTAEGFVLRSRDAGQTWHEERVPTRAPMFDAVITDAATFVLGNVDVILRGPR